MNTDLFIQYIRPELLVPAIFAWLLERAKQAEWISFITPETQASVLKMWSALLAIAGAVGITAQYDAGTLTVTGLTLANALSLVVLVIQNYVIQHFTYEKVLKPKPKE